jgi:hypothetical protein
MRSSAAAFHQINAVKRTMLASTNRDIPITWSEIPSCWASQLAQPTTTGIRIAAGSNRRAMTPPAPVLLTTAIIPRSGRAQRMPAQDRERERGVQRHRVNR